MSIAEFIRESILRPRLKQAGCLVVYDPDQRFREQCRDLAGDQVRVVDASVSSIESREAALLALREVGQPQSPLEGVLIYVPAKRPETDEQKQVDPFALYAECGAVLPYDDGDDYLSLCLRARPDHATAIRQVFARSPTGPSFAVIDAIGGGVSWPQLRATLRRPSGPCSGTNPGKRSSRTPGPNWKKATTTGRTWPWPTGPSACGRSAGPTSRWPSPMAWSIDTLSERLSLRG